MYVHVHVLYMICTCTTRTGIIISTSIIITSISTNIHTIWTCTCTCNLYSMYSTSTCINLQSIKQMFRYGCIYPLCRMTCKKWPSIHFNWHYVWYFYKLFHSFDFHSNNEGNQDNHIQRKNYPYGQEKKTGRQRGSSPTPNLYRQSIIYKYYNIIIVCTCTTVWTSNTCMYKKSVHVTVV